MKHIQVYCVGQNRVKANHTITQDWPVGHWMFSWTRVCLRVPSMAAVSILGWFPQSAQYMVLKGNTGLEKRIKKHLQQQKKPREKLFMLSGAYASSLTLSEDPLRWRRARRSSQRWGSCSAALTSEPLQWHLDQNRSSTNFQPPSPLLCPAASSALWSGHKDGVNMVFMWWCKLIPRESFNTQHSITCRLVTLPSLWRRLRWELEEADDSDGWSS